MISFIKSSIVIIAIAGAVNACGSFVSTPAGANAIENNELGSKVPASDATVDACDLSGIGTSVDAYKKAAAYRVASANLGSTFEGRLPPMLPAIVVLRISVDKTGTVTDVQVQRSRDANASQIAMASIHRTGNFPFPCGLIKDENGALSFSETFLFNDQYQFQLRSLAGPQ